MPALEALQTPEFPFFLGAFSKPGRPEAPAGNVKVTGGGLYAPGRGLPARGLPVIVLRPWPSGLLC